MHKPIYAAIASPLGGVGKTTLTVMTASYLHYQRGYQLAVMDCTNPFFSAATIRKMETDAIGQTPYMQKCIKKLYPKGKKAYPIIPTMMDMAINQAKERYEKDEEIELILFDIPILLTVDGTCELLSKMDVVIFPFTTDIVAINATQRLIDTLNQLIITTGHAAIKAIYLLETKAENSDERDSRSKSKALADMTGTALMTTRMPYSQTFRKMLYEAEDYRGISTLLPNLLPMEKELAAEIDKIVQELCGGK